MAKLHEITVWVRINEHGDYDVGCTAEEAGERFEEHIGHDNETGYRNVVVTLRVPLPEQIELSGEVPADETPGTVAAKVA